MTSDKIVKKNKKERKKEKKRKREEENDSDDNDNDTAELLLLKEEKRKKRKSKKSKKDERKLKKEKKKKRSKDINDDNDNISSHAKDVKAIPNKDDVEIVGGRIVSFSADVCNPSSCTKKSSTSSTRNNTDNHTTTLLLFYQYIEPLLNNTEFQSLLNHVQAVAEKYDITGRMRVSTEGLNCTLTGSYDNIRSWCKELRNYTPDYFKETEFKLTDDLPDGQRFPKLHAFKVDEIVNYGLVGPKAPRLNMSGVHLEPKAYHEKMKEDDTVIIDVRNHYEAAIGKFIPPEGGATYIDPKMRKSTEFPIWLDKPETKEMLRNKQVLMYCTGGVRCERASALLKTKMEHEDDTKELGIKGVYQLQGGIDKYFRDFPEGGWWRGKNYVFDKRFSHAPPVQEHFDRIRKLQQHQKKEGCDNNENDNIGINDTSLQVMGKCEACQKPWDKYRGKRRCPTCGVPSLICKECYDLDNNKIKKLDKSIRCELCVEEGITHKSQIKQREEKEMEQYEIKLRNIYGFHVTSNPNKNNNSSSNTRKKKNNNQTIATNNYNNEPCTRLFLKNLCAKSINQEELLNLIPQITHIDWLKDRITKKWYGSVFVEVSTLQDANHAVDTLHGKNVFGRTLSINYSKHDPKSIWPPSHLSIY